MSHDNDNQLGRDFVEYEESVIYGFFKKCQLCFFRLRPAPIDTPCWSVLGSGPTYAALGNVSYLSRL